MKRTLLNLIFAICTASMFATIDSGFCDLGSNIEACEGDIVNLDAGTGVPSDTYEWFFENPVGSGTYIPFSPPETTATLSVTVNGNYRVEVDRTGTICTSEVLVNFNPLPPDFGPFDDVVLCDDELNGSTSDDTISTFDITIRNMEIVGGDPSLTVTWFESFVDEASDTPIVNPTAYQNVLNPQTAVARISSPFDCRTLVTIDLVVVPLPSPVMPSPLNYCDFDNDGFGEFDLTTKDAEIANGEPNVSIRYYETQLTADLGDPIDALISPYINVVSNFQTVYARVTYEVPPAQLACYEVVPLDLVVVNLPNVPDSSFVNPVIALDTNGDGIELFDLTINEAAIFGVQSPSDFAPINYYESQADAETNINPIAVPQNFVSTGQTIWTRLENLITGCYRVTPFDIVVQGVTIASPPTDIFNNEGDGDGLAIFDLTVNETQMLGSLDPTVYLFTYHVTLSNANNGVNPIANPTAYQNIANPQTIHVRLTNDTNGSYALTNFVIETDGVLGNETFFKNSFVLSPNPTSGTLFIKAFQPNADVTIAVYDIRGSLLIAEVIENTSEMMSLDVSQLPSGMFYVQITSEGNKTIKQLIKN